MATITDTSTESRRLRSGERERHYLLTRPIPAQTSPPLVLVFHGSNQTPDTVRGYTEPGFDSLAAHDGAVVVYPKGYKRQWNDARASLDFATRSEGIDDVGFVRELVDELARTLGVDRRRVYGVGFSNGGHLVSRLAHEVPDLFAGIAMIAATQPTPDNFQPASDAGGALPVLLILGTEDRLAPYDGRWDGPSETRPRGVGLSGPDTAQYWARRNGIVGPGTSQRLLGPEGNTTSVERLILAEPGRQQVVLDTIHGGGHVLPGRKPGPVSRGLTSPDLETVDEVALFFGLRAPRA